MHNRPTRIAIFCQFAAAQCFAAVPVQAGAGDMAIPKFTIQPSQAYVLTLTDGAAFRLASAYRPAVVPALILPEKPYALEIDRAARSEGLDPALVHAVIDIESRHNAKAISPKGAIGLMQVMPETAARFGKGFRLAAVDDNLRAGTHYLRVLVEMFDQRLDLALAAYNAGEGAVSRYGNHIPPYAETRHYVPAVMARYQEWKRRAIAS